MAAADDVGFNLMAGSVRLFVFGLGYSGLEIARAISAHGAWVGGTVRNEEKAARLRAEDLSVSVFDGMTPGQGIGEALKRATHILISIAPGESGDRVIAHHASDIRAAENLAWIGYLSSVGVYGNYGGAWVSERTTPHPRPGRSANRLEAENVWRLLAEDCEVPLARFRIAGIYGPGRNALKKLADGTARRIIKTGQVFNRIHVADIALTVLAAIERNADGIFNLTDNEPGPPQDVVEYAAGLMGVPVPPELPFETSDLSPMARSFYGENKRILNRRIRQGLAVELCYPTYRDGLSAMWNAGDWRGDDGDRNA